MISWSGNAPPTAASGVARRHVPSLTAAVVVAAGLAALNPVAVLAATSVGLVVAAFHRTLFAWRTLIGVVAAVILFIPIRRFTFLPGALPIEIEPYRVVIALVVIAWVGSLLVQPNTRFRRAGIEGPVLLLVAALMLSVTVNADTVEALGAWGNVLKGLSFFASYLCVMYLVASTITRRGDIDALLKLLVGGGALLAGLAVFEAATGLNYFNRLGEAIPGLSVDLANLPGLNDGEQLASASRAGRSRVYASAEHPIALGAALTVLVPLAVYLGMRTGRWYWWAMTGLLALGVLATLSRTGIIMLLAAGVVLVWLKPAATRRLVPLVIPFLLVAHFAVPGALGGLKASFFPTGGLVAEQDNAHGGSGQGRVADLGPALAQWAQNPVVGQGFGTRPPPDPGRPAALHAQILDNQWLGLLVETGLLGVLALAWLLTRLVRRLGRLAKADSTLHGWLLAAFAGSIASFAIGMFTFDAFAYSQVTFLLFILMGLAIASLRPEPAAEQPLRSAA